jgi:hypothetical protein
VFPYLFAASGTNRHDVLLRHRLLPQPGGFEGLIARPVLAAPVDLPVSERVKRGVSQTSLDAAELGASADPEDRDDVAVSCVNPLDGLLLKSSNVSSQSCA